MKAKRIFIWVSFLAIVMVTIPYIFAFLGGKQEWVFGGFLLNPIDGHSYLAKMQQGFQGSWKFVLPYTAVPGEGAYLFLFYISLGHIGRIFDIPLIVVFHAFRLIGSIVLLYSIRKLCIDLFQESRDQLIMFSLAVLGSGLGWAGVLFGQFTGDFWVAEAYPFLSMYANPHFPLGLAILILMLIPGEMGFGKSLLAGLVLSILQPFAVVIVLVIFAVNLFREMIGPDAMVLNRIIRTSTFQSLLGAGIGGGSVLLYQYFSILNEPVLSIWHAQNITPPPSGVDFLISFSPVLILAAVGVKASKKSKTGSVMLTWAMSALMLLLIPWNLQRRFLSGIYVPLAVLAVFGIKELIDQYHFSYRTIAAVLFILVIPTNLIVVVAGVQASRERNDSIYYSAELAQGLEWISDNTAPEDIFLTDPKTGLLVPSIAGRRVVYGHPFETANANIELDYINTFFAEKMDPAEGTIFLEQRKIDFVMVTKEVIFSNESLLISNGYVIVFENADTIIFSK